MPYRVYRDGDQWCVHLLNADGSQGERVSGGCHSTESEANRHQRALEANVTEMFFTDVLAVTELRGGFPEVPYFEDVDVKELTAEDSDPVFLTLPIGKANSTSGNHRFYDENFVRELENQTRSVRPIGLMGHLKEEEKDHVFPDEAVHWVGVKREGDMLWGKGYVPPGPARQRVRRYKAQGKALATSIYAKARGEWDKARNAVHMVAETLQLQQIDIGPADRVGIPDLAHVPILTSEFQGNGDDTSEGDPAMEKLQVIQELKADDARMLPEEVKTAILETKPEPAEVQTVKEIRGALEVDEKADVVKAITEMVEREAERAKQDVEAKLDALLADENKGIKIKPVAAHVKEMVQARQPATPKEVETIYDEVIARDSVKELLTMQVSEMMGGNQSGPGPNGGGNNQEGKYFKIPEKEQQGA